MAGSAELKWNVLVARLGRRVLGVLERVRAAIVKRSGRGKARRMVLLESLSLGNRRQLFLVACDEHRFLVGAGADRVGTLVAVPENTPEASVLRPAGPQPPTADAQASDWQPAWSRDRLSAGGGTGEARGLRLVKRGDQLHVPEDRRCDTETGRAQW